MIIKEQQLIPPTELRQISDPYFSTIAFEGFLKKHGAFSEALTVLDVGTGLGANLHYFQKRYPNIHWTGCDYNEFIIQEGQALLKAHQVNGVALKKADIFDLPDAWVAQYDGIMSIHNFCCFKNLVKPIASLCKLKPKWIAINSLFYEGPLDVLIHIRAHDMPEIADDNPDGDFNIFSIAKTKAIFEMYGYSVDAVEPFYPPQPLPKPEHGRRGTYTMKTEWHEHTQFSGPVHLPWQFMLAKRQTK